MECGYSFGADIIPFILPHLPSDLSERLVRAIMISPDINVDFEIHISDYLHLDNKSETYDVPKGVHALSQYSLVCLFGDEEDTHTALLFEKAGAEIKILPGKNHFNNDYTTLMNQIIFLLPIDKRGKSSLYSRIEVTICCVIFVKKKELKVFWLCASRQLGRNLSDLFT